MELNEQGKIESLESDAEIEADEALWDAQFASTPTSVFDALIKKALADDAAGLTEECE
ncbi:MAG: hypothetical protein KF726_02050 [Anaerolineae bacterium]|nr:hypothetical protein [Anaerolineae bacterium]